MEKDNAMIEINGNISLIPLVDKEYIRKKAKSKRKRYSYLKDKVDKLIPWFCQQINVDNKFNDRYIRSKNFNEITIRTRDLAEKMGLANKSDYALYSGLKFILFFEGFALRMVNNGKENFFKIKVAYNGYGLSPSVIKTLDNLELDGWQIKRNYDYMYFNHGLKKDKNGTYILESEGNIFFDRRSLTEEQALEFVKYFSGKDLRAPDFIYLTPINVVLSDKNLEHYVRYIDFDIDNIGREFRIVKSGDSGFIVTSIYGKECSIEEFDVDSLIKGCSTYGILNNFNKTLSEEKVSERIDILKKIIPDIGKISVTKNIVMIDNKKLIIINSIGKFHISLIDGTLHKIYDIGGKSGEDKYNYKYICVGPISCRQNSIIYNGRRYDIDRITGIIISKMNMLLQEIYPDILTKNQIMT